MFRFSRIASLVAFMPLFFSGCANYWYQEGKTFEECKQARLECYTEMKMYSYDPDDLGKYEFKLMQDCMIQKGYRLVTDNRLHVRVKREDPDLDVAWMVHGIAGFIPEDEQEQYWQELKEKEEKKK